MKFDFQRHPRPGLRILFVLIALLTLGYLVEVYYLGAPEMRGRTFGFRDKDARPSKNYHRVKDPVPFWTHVAVVAAFGGFFAYFSIDWKRIQPRIASYEERDRQTLEALGPKYARIELRNRRFQLATICLIGAGIVAMLVGLWL